MTQDQNDIMQERYEALLIEYAAGTLDRAQTMIVSAHLQLSGKGQKLVNDCQYIAANLVEKNCTPVAMNEASLDHVLNKLDRKENPKMQNPIFPEDVALPECVQERVKCRPRKQIRWKPVYPGIHGFSLPLECRRSKAHVFKLKPGTITPSHAHKKLEITLILDGAFSDNAGSYTPGDLIVSDEHTPAHSPAACEKWGCVYLSVFSGPIEIKGLLGSLLNPFIRF